MSNPTPRVSVVVASIVGPPFIDDCLRSLEAQARRHDAEVIAVACGTREYACRIERQFPWVRVVHQPRRVSVPELRRQGVETARGDLVAIIEEHCLAKAGWLDQAVAAMEAGIHAAAGGPVADHDYRRLRDWVVYFCEYNGSLPPAAQAEVAHLNGANIVYRRDVLLAFRPFLHDGYWETSLHPRLLEAGHRFLSVPEMVVVHRGPFNFGYYLQQRYWFSRAFAGARAKTLPLGRRLAYLVAAPLVPGLLLARMAARVWQKRCHVDKFGRALPLLVPAVVVYVAGEWIGYLAGPGKALLKVE